VSGFLNLGMKNRHGDLLESSRQMSRLIVVVSH